eukprot:gene33027-42726_t
MSLRLKLILSDTLPITSSLPNKFAIVVDNFQQMKTVADVQYSILQKLGIRSEVAICLSLGDFQLFPSETARIFREDDVVTISGSLLDRVSVGTTSSSSSGSLPSSSAARVPIIAPPAAQKTCTTIVNVKVADVQNIWRYFTAAASPAPPPPKGKPPRPQGVADLNSNKRKRNGSQPSAHCGELISAAPVGQEPASILHTPLSKLDLITFKIVTESPQLQVDSVLAIRLLTLCERTLTPQISVLLLANPLDDSLQVRVLEEGRAGSASHLLIVNEEVTVRWSDLAEVRLLQGNLTYTTGDKNSMNSSSGGGDVNSSGNGDNQGAVTKSVRPNLGQTKQVNKKKSNGKKKGSNLPPPTMESSSHINSDDVNSSGRHVDSSSGSTDSVDVYTDDLTDFHEMIQRKRQRLENPVNS